MKQREVLLESPLDGVRSKNKDVSELVASLVGLEFKNCFNPYKDLCSRFDRPDSAEIRTKNISKIIDAACSAPNVDLWLGRDLGYRGGRRTGVALTDEANLCNYARLIGVDSIEKSTTGPEISERTASVVYIAMRMVDIPILTWNVFPLHPHEPDKPMSNRQHNRAEADAGARLLMNLISIIKVRNVISIGNDAFSALQAMDVDCKKVRHPSYGGQRMFLEGMSTIYSKSKVVPTQGELF